MSPEPLEYIILKKQTFPYLWALLAPKEDFRGLQDICRRRWEDKFTYRQQQQIYWFLREKKRKGEKIYENPLYAITYCYPRPYNWNGKSALDDQLKKEKMVSACYKGSFGIYPKNVAEYFEMTNVQPLN